MKTLSLLALAGLTLSTFAPAESLNPAHIGADASWVFHMDFDGMKDTRLDEFTCPKMDSPAYAKKMEEFETKMGLDLEKDLHAMTLYGNGERERGVFLLHADVDADKLVTMVKEKSSYASSTHHNVVIHSWKDQKMKKMGGGQMYGCLHSSGQIVLSSRKADVEAAVDVLDGRKESLGNETELGKLLSKDPDVIMVGAMSLAGIEDMGPKAAMFQDATYSVFEVLARENELEGTLALTMKTDASATQISDIGNGMLSMALMTGQENPILADVVEQITITAYGNSVVSRMVMPFDQLKEVEAELRKMKANCKTYE